MQKAIDVLQGQLVGIRSRTVSAGLLDSIKVQCRGQSEPLGKIASTSPRATGVEVFPFDLQDSRVILKAIQEAGFQAYQFSKAAIMVSVPEITGESKSFVVARIKKLGEEAKIAVRNIRKNYRARDDKKADKALQVITDKAIQEIDCVVESKIRSL